MTCLIDADALMKKIDQSFRDAGLHDEDYRKIKKWIAKTPTIEQTNCIKCIHYSEVEDDNGVYGKCNRTDLISRADVLDAFPEEPKVDDVNEEWAAHEMWRDCVEAVKIAPSADLTEKVKPRSNGDLISRADAIEAVCDDCGSDGSICGWVKRKNDCPSIKYINALPSATTETKSEKSNGDLISRADAIHILACEMFASAQSEGFDVDSVDDSIPEVTAWMNDATSADRQTGEWIGLDKLPDRPAYKWYQCNRCQMLVDAKVNFCPRCGADMTKYTNSGK